MYLYKMSLMLVMCYMAFRTRNMSADFQEARFIFYSSHELLFCVVIIVPLTHLVNLTPTYRHVLQSTGMLLVYLVCISLTLGTRIRLALMGTTATREEARKSGERARASEMAITSEMARTSDEASSEVDIRRSGQPSSSAASEQHSEGSFNKGSPKGNDSALVKKIDLLSAHNAILEEQIKILTLKANAEQVD